MIAGHSHETFPNVHTVEIRRTSHNDVLYINQEQEKPTDRYILKHSPLQEAKSKIHSESRLDTLSAVLQGKYYSARANLIIVILPRYPT